MLPIGRRGHDIRPAGCHLVKEFRREDVYPAMTSRFHTRVSAVPSPHLSLALASSLLVLTGLTGCRPETSATPTQPSAAAATPSVVAYESFAYRFKESETNVIDSLGGGIGFLGTWQKSIRGTSGARHAIVSDSLEYPGASRPRLRTEGGACRVDPAENALLWTSRPLSREHSGHLDGEIRYLSFLVRPEGVLGEGALAGYFTVGLLGTRSAVFAGRPGGDRMDRYVIETQGGGGQVASDVKPTLGKTALLVIKIEFKPGNDVFTLYVDPPLGAGEPAVGARKMDEDIGAPGEVVLYSTGAHSLDEIRFGRTYAEVVPVE
jgi:hypothetical protein